MRVPNYECILYFLTIPRCARHPGVPSYCTMVNDPKDQCCQVPYCPLPQNPQPQNTPAPTPGPDGQTLAPNPNPNNYTPAPSGRLMYTHIKY